MSTSGRIEFITNLQFLLLVIAGKSLVLAIFSYLSFMLGTNFADIKNDGLVVVGFGLILILTVYLIFSLGANLVSLAYKNSNSLVILEDKLVYKINGQVIEFEYAKIKNLKQVRVSGSNRPFPVFGKYYIEFEYADKKYEIGKSNFFKNFNSFVTILTSKLNV